jgi:hypothetical protein
VREEVVKWAGDGCWAEKELLACCGQKKDGWAAGLERRGDRGLVLVVFSFLFLFQPFTQKSFPVFKNYFKNFLNHTTKLKPMHST